MNRLIIMIFVVVCTLRAQDSIPERVVNSVYLLNIHGGYPVSALGVQLVGGTIRVGNIPLFVGTNCMEIGADWYSGDAIDSAYAVFSFLTLHTRYIFNDKRPASANFFKPVYLFGEVRPLQFYNFQGTKSYGDTTKSGFHWANVSLKTGIGVEFYWHRIAKLSSTTTETITQKTVSYKEFGSEVPDNRPFILKILNPSIGIQCGYYYRPSYLDPNADKIIAANRHDFFAEITLAITMANLETYSFKRN